MRGVVVWAVLALVLSPFGPAAAKDAYPTRPIHWIVPFPPGGPTDTQSRVQAAKFGDVWKPGIVIDSKGGASGAIGVDFAAKSAPDGYTIHSSAPRAPTAPTRSSIPTCRTIRSPTSSP